MRASGPLAKRYSYPAMTQHVSFASTQRACDCSRWSVVMGSASVLRALALVTLATLSFALHQGPGAVSFLANTHVSSRIRATARRSPIVASKYDIDDDFYIQDTYKVIMISK